MAGRGPRLERDGRRRLRAVLSAQTLLYPNSPAERPRLCMNLFLSRDKHRPCSSLVGQRWGRDSISVSSVVFLRGRPSSLKGMCEVPHQWVEEMGDRPEGSTLFFF